MQALNNYVVLEQQEEPQTSAGGIILTRAESTTIQCKVKSVGDQSVASVHKDDIVILRKGTGLKIKHQGYDYLMCQDTDILAKVGP